MKYLLWIALIVALVWLLRPRRKLKSGDPHAGVKSDSASQPVSEAMVSCRHCGVHIPASEALTSVSGALVCSNEHRKLHDELHGER